ncbi:hypothetical protein [Hymenobacter cellulosilyticus]|uniref:Uncharacterized protein n=1 Tax=Hymenobacter cellulosilyticus TaxID=2932248 RepID=A0A8T9Q7A1_9BACT|nr:hypothetical protein [Hymenobacter cellulosilyticus]UOQ73466.1 hypothetical protein MUN79_05880 [Hymenobacter cellulosilyticus]
MLHGERQQNQGRYRHARGPNSMAENTTSPFFIRINDVPQIVASVMSSTQAEAGVRWGGATLPEWFREQR